jgi:hypothetical protein
MSKRRQVMQGVRKAQRKEAPSDPKRKLAAVRRAAEHSFPTAGIERMLAEIDRGYLHD